MKGIAFGMLALVLAGVAVSGAYAGWGFNANENIQTAIENGDYDSWKDAMMDRISEENFNELQERYETRNTHMEQREAANEALLEGDYEAYLEAVDELNTQRASISEEDFEQLSELHQNRVKNGFEHGIEHGFEHGPMEGCGRMGRMEGRGMHNSAEMLS